MRSRKAASHYTLRHLRIWTVPEAIRDVVGALSAEADAHAAKLADGHDAKALHDLRVTIRRIRAILRAYESFLPPSCGAARTELTELMRQTNVSRDLEVHKTLLKQLLEQKRLETGAQQTTRVLLDHMNQRHAAEDDDNQRTARALMKSVVVLRHALNQHHGESGDVLYSVATGAIVQREAHKLLTLNLSLQRKGQVKRLHRTRISAKRLRYVLEPLPNVVAGVRDGIARLKRLQTLLGNIRDMQTLKQLIRESRNIHAGPAWKAELDTVRGVVRAEEDRLFAVFQKKRTGGQMDRLEARMRQISDALTAISRPTRQS